IMRSMQVPAKEEKIKGNEDLVILYLFLSNVVRSNYNCIKDFLWSSKDGKVFGNGDIVIEKKEQSIILKSPFIEGSFMTSIYNFIIKEVNNVIFIEPNFGENLNLL